MFVSVLGAGAGANSQANSQETTAMEVSQSWVKVRSYYAAIPLCCRTAAYCTEIAMLLHCSVAWKLNSFWLEMRWSCGDLRQKVIEISAPQRNCSVVWTNLKIMVEIVLKQQPQDLTVVAWDLHSQVFSHWIVSLFCLTSHLTRLTHRYDSDCYGESLNSVSVTQWKSWI